MLTSYIAKCYIIGNKISKIFFIVYQFKNTTGMINQIIGVVVALNVLKQYYPHRKCVKNYV